MKYNKLHKKGAGASLKTVLATVVMLSTSAVYADNDETAFQDVEGDLSVMVLGSGGPIATAEGRASAGYLIFLDGKPRILMDVGGGTYQRLAQSGTNIRGLDIVLLSHLHADHTGDLTSVIKTIYFHNLNARNAGLTDSGRTKPIHIFGPDHSYIPTSNPGIVYDNGEFIYPATNNYVDDHYSMDTGVERYLTAFVNGISDDNGPLVAPNKGVSEFHYNVTNLPSNVPMAAMQPLNKLDLTEVPDIGDLEIYSIAVDHGPVPSVAFRISYKGHTVIYSGDTGTKGLGAMHLGQGNMLKITQGMGTPTPGADMLIYDTAIMDFGDNPPNPLFHILHTEPSLIGGVARDAGVKTLVLSHITPVTSPRLDEVKEIIENVGYEGKIKVAKDLKVYNFGDD